MRTFKTIGIALALLLTLSACGKRAIYLRTGTVGIIEQPVEVEASVPGEDGKLVPNTKVELPAGTEFKYSGPQKAK